MSQENHKNERIAKVIARAGLCSRREAERWIEGGRVSVNGKTLNTPAFKVSKADKIVVDGKALQSAQETRLFLYNKPAGLVTTNKDERGRETVFDKLPADLPRVMSVGRLDMNTEGLLLLTNDGALARCLELPENGWRRRYRVRAYGKVNEKRLESLKKGIRVDGIRYEIADVSVDSIQGHNAWLTMVLQEGKNREIRRVLEAIDLQVNRLIRTSYGPFNLDKLTGGGVKEVSQQVLKDQISGYFKQKEGGA